MALHRQSPSTVSEFSIYHKAQLLYVVLYGPLHKLRTHNGCVERAAYGPIGVEAGPGADDVIGIVRDDLRRSAGSSSRGVG
jgi:hypothetical protein